jgi:hypothetical protein
MIILLVLTFLRYAYACQHGYYIRDGLCLRCPAGYYCPDKLNIFQCKNGEKSLDGYSYCFKHCPHGYVTDFYNKRACIGCPAKHYAYNDALPCQFCGNDAFSLPLSGVCTKSCPNGYSCVQDQQELCPPGTYKNNASSYTCEECPPNTCAPSYGTIDCEPC